MIFQTAACLLYLIYFFYNNNLLQRHVEKRFKQIKDRIYDFYPKEYASFALNDLSKKDGLLITVAWRDFHREVEEDFKRSDSHNMGHKNEDDFNAFYKREIKGG